MKIEVIENGISYFAPEVFGTISAFKNPEVYLDGKLMPCPDPVRALRSLMCTYFCHNGGNPSMSEKDIETYYEDRYLQQSPYSSEAVNPTHHKNFDSKGRQWLENWAAEPGRTSAEVYAAVKVLADKYIDRCGRKDSPAQEIEKALWYYRFGCRVNTGNPTGSSVRDFLKYTGAFDRIIYALDCPGVKAADATAACVALLRYTRTDMLTSLVGSAILLHFIRRGSWPTNIDQLHEIIESV